ncbi:MULTISPECIES: hypothetical protein [unclassified Bradyrhizobium]|uniref:hypothetical protein n=1 Tax=unclassified Bradyrhizobium TaxID=2631580 RepID=UPI0028E29D91|nr:MULTISPECIES: hypothetical protein [unclassified Bradyrhizobium]
MDFLHHRARNLCRKGTIRQQPGDPEMPAAPVTRLGPQKAPLIRWGGSGLECAMRLGCAIFTPDLWREPLGALVKTGPAIVLMLVALSTLDNR